MNVNKKWLGPTKGNAGGTITPAGYYQSEGGSTNGFLPHSVYRALKHPEKGPTMADFTVKATSRRV